MSLRRNISHGNVPFSWEEKPGVSKFRHSKKIPAPTNVLPQNDKPPPLLPPPPPSSSATQTPSRRSSSSLRALIRDDPFMVAFVECTKNRASVVKNSKIILHDDNNSNQRKNCGVGLSSKKGGGRFLFFCKNAYEDVEVDNLMMMKYSDLPPLPLHKDSKRFHRR